MVKTIIKYVLLGLASLAVLFLVIYGAFALWTNHVNKLHQEGRQEGVNTAILQIIDTIKRTGEFSLPYKDQAGQPQSITLIEKHNVIKR